MCTAHPWDLSKPQLEQCSSQSFFVFRNRTASGIIIITSLGTVIINPEDHGICIIYYHQISSVSLDFIEHNGVCRQRHTHRLSTYSVVTCCLHATKPPHSGTRSPYTGTYSQTNKDFVTIFLLIFVVSQKLISMLFEAPALDYMSRKSGKQATSATAYVWRHKQLKP